MKKFNKILACILAAVMMLTLVPMSVFAADDGNTVTPTADSGWTAISTKEDFLTKLQTAGNYYLTTDIDFEEYEAPYLVQNFSGILDGRGHSIYNFKLTLDNTHQDVAFWGVFGTLCNSSKTTIMNLNIGKADAYVTATLNQTQKTFTESYTSFGFLAGRASGVNDTNIVIVDNVNVYGNFTANAVALAAPYRAAGLIGNTYGHIITNVTTNGSITCNNTDSQLAYGGGMIGIAEKISTDSWLDAGNIIDKCTNNMSILDAVQEGGSFGGILGRMNVSVMITDCKNTGDISMVTTGGTTHNKNAAGILGSKNIGTLVIKNCVNTGTIKTTYRADNDVFGNVTGHSGYVYIHNNKNVNGDFVQECAYGNLTTSGALTEITVHEISNLTEFLAIKNDVKGIYRLTNDIELTDTYTNTVLNIKFNGIIDGDGHTIKGYKVAGTTSGDVGIIAGIGHNDSVGSGTDVYGARVPIIMDLNVGTADEPAELTVPTTSNNCIGLLVAYAGQGDNTTAIIKGCNVYAEYNYTGTRKNAVGMIAGSLRRGLVYGCNTYGYITADKTIASGDTWINVGGVIGQVEKKANIIKCNNFADITVNSVSGGSLTESRAGGVIGYIGTYYSSIYDCSNFGKITCNSNVTTPIAGGIVGQSAASSYVEILNCENFGDITGKKYVASGIGYAGRTHMGNHTNFGSVISEDSASANYFLNKQNDTVTLGNCVKADLITMVEKASVRLVEGESGLRFRAIISDLAMAKLNEIVGEDNVSYGIMIGPKTLVGSSAFTREETAKSSYLEATVGKDAWFKDEKGVIAVSATGIPAEGYSTDMTATAFADIKVNGTVVATLYSDNACTRNIKEVAQAALNDVAYNENGHWKDLDGETVTDPTEYTHDTGSVIDIGGTEYTIYSCYDAPSRAILENYVNGVAN